MRTWKLALGVTVGALAMALLLWWRPTPMGPAGGTEQAQSAPIAPRRPHVAHPTGAMDGTEAEPPDPPGFVDHLVATGDLITRCRRGDTWALELQAQSAEVALLRDDLTDEERARAEELRDVARSVQSTPVFRLCDWMAPATPPRELVDSWSGRDALSP